MIFEFETHRGAGFKEGITFWVEALRLFLLEGVLGGAEMD